MLELHRLTSADSDFWQQLETLTAWQTEANNLLEQVVRNIVQDVRRNGDKALLDYTRRFDNRSVQQVQECVITPERLHQALANLDKTQRKALEQSAKRIHYFHERQKQESWQYTEPDGTILGQQVSPIAKVGIYVPGGKAAYPSSVLMTAIPAKVAGVPEIIMVVPAPHNSLNDIVLAAAVVAGVDQVFTIGGAQAIAALAYGTESIPRVDKIVGPGNIYVAMAKSLVFGTVGIDMMAGPSEILVICDGKTDPDWIAMDLFSQAEHDEQAQAILVSPDADFLGAVYDSLNTLIKEMPRAAIIQAALKNRGALIQVKDLHEAIEVANFVAPEHLELSIDNPKMWAQKIRHAGAIFLGRYTAEAIGDYCAGPNHVLPTCRSARFSSPLGVYDFQKRSSLIQCSQQGAHTLGKIAASLAHAEGLTAHACSAEYRVAQFLLEASGSITN